MKEKSLPFAIGLNLILPGLGYLYMGRWLAGILGGALVIAMIAVSTIMGALLTWLVVNVIMAIDMIMLHRKREKRIAAQTTMACPECAETIKREARVCRYCQTRLADDSANTAA